jgi:hypothetical protein
MTEPSILQPTTTDVLGSRVRKAVAAMSRHHVVMSDDYQRAEAVYRTARDVTATPAPAFVLPADAKKANASITAHAKALSEHAALTPAAHAASQAAQRVMSDELDRVLPQWFALLVDGFATALETFRSIEVSHITGHEDEKTILAFGRRTKAATELDACWSERCQLGAAIDEPGAQIGSVWTVVEPDYATPTADAPPESRRPWIDCVNGYRDLALTYWPQHIAALPAAERWDLMLEKGACLRLARNGEIQSRSWWFNEIRDVYSAGFSPSLPDMLADDARLRAPLTRPDAQAA